MYIHYLFLFHIEELSFGYFRHNSIHTPDVSESSNSCFLHTFLYIPMLSLIANRKSRYPTCPIGRWIHPKQCPRGLLYHLQIFLHTGRKGHNNPRKVVWKLFLLVCLEKDIFIILRFLLVFHFNCKYIIRKSAFPKIFFLFFVFGMKLWKIR